MNESGGPKPIRDYVDTSVFGGVFDEEFADYSRAFFLRVDRGEVIVMLGDTTERELSEAPERARSLIDAIPATGCERCDSSGPVIQLAEAHLAARVVSPKWRGDAVQVATATVYKADVLVS